MALSFQTWNSVKNGSCLHPRFLAQLVRFVNCDITKYICPGISTKVYRYPEKSLAKGLLSVLEPDCDIRKDRLLAENPLVTLKRGRKRVNHEQTPLRLPKGTLARIDAVVEHRESRADLLRAAVAHELTRRESKMFAD